MRLVGRIDVIEDIAKYYRDLQEEIKTAEAKMYMEQGHGKQDSRHSAMVYKMKEELLELQKTLLPYVAPKLKAAEVSGPDGGPAMPSEIKVTFE